MEKQKRWQFLIIVSVVLLTIYSILPTIFYYSKPLKKYINEKTAHSIALDITKRVNDHENIAKE